MPQVGPKTSKDHSDDKVESDDNQAATTIQRDSDSGRGRTSSSSASGSEHDDQAECFVDASDGSWDNSQPEDSSRPELLENAPLSQRLEETTIILRKALNNEFVLALDLCSRRQQRELYASLAHATLSFLRAALTLEQGDLQAALESINHSFEVSGEQRRKSSTASMVMRFLYRPDYNANYTDDEIHAELVHAESLLMLALISFLADQSILCLVKGAFRIRTCYQRYKECLYIMETRKSWQSPEAQRHFESGVRMGYGIFNLLMSYLPRRVLRFLQYVGFSGNRSVGVDELERSVKLDDGLRSVFSTLVILAYHSYVENLFGLGTYDELKVAELNKSLQDHYPNSAFYLLFKGRYDQMLGNLNEAIVTFEQCILAQNDWHQFHAICHWEIMWCYCAQMDWKQAAKYSDLLRKKSKWSPASYTYQYGTFLYAQLVEDERQGLCKKEDEEYRRRMDEIEAIIKSVPNLRIRYAGKTIPAEKFAITRSQRFLDQQNRLSLPALEFLYIWNVFSILKNAKQTVEKLLERINSEIDIIKNQAGDNDNDNDDDEVCDDYVDDYALMLLLKGMCLKNLHRYEEAEESFMEVIDIEPRINHATFLVPHTAMELATLNLTLKRFEGSKCWIKMARNNYTGYLLETIVHFRLHAASRAIRMDSQEQELNGSTLSVNGDSTTIRAKSNSEIVVAAALAT